MTEIKNPEKKKSRKPMTSIEKILSAIESSKTRSDNFFLILYEANTFSFRFHRQDLDFWALILAQNKLREILSEYEKPEYLDRKEPKEVAAIARGTDLPYFYADFPTAKSTVFNWSTNMHQEKFHDRAELFLRMLDIMISTEGMEWHIYSRQPAQPQSQITVPPKPMH